MADADIPLEKWHHMFVFSTSWSTLVLRLRREKLHELGPRKKPEVFNAAAKMSL